MIDRGGWALIKSTWASWLQYRSFFFLLAFGWMLPPLIYMFVWSNTAGSQASAGMNRGEFVAYYLILILVNQFTYPQTNWTVGDMIREGDLNAWLLRPMPFIYQVFSTEVAGKVVTLIFVAPICALFAILFKPELHASASQVGIFRISLAMAWWLRFLWGYTLALLAFWATRADALLAVQEALIFLLAGVIAPTTLLPDTLHLASVVLPFRYMLGFPVEILCGQASAGPLWTGLLIQGAWLILTSLAYVVVWRAGLRRYSAIGG